MTPGEPLTAPEDPTKEGYIFLGWLPAVPPSVPDEDATYTAQWAYAVADYSAVDAALDLADDDILPVNAVHDPEYMVGGAMYIDGEFTNDGFYERSMFTEASLGAMSIPINRNLSSADQATVDGYAATIMAAYNNLELAPADYTELNNYMNQAENLNRDFYSAEDLASVDEAMGFAYIEVAANYKKPLQDGLEAITVLLQAVLFELPADVSIIIDTWNDFQANYVQSNYTPESWDRVVSYYDDVISWELPSYFQSDVEILNNNLLVLISELVLKDVTYTVKYQTIFGVTLLEDMTGYAKATDEITEYAPEVTGYTPVQASVQQTMTGIDTENVIVFTYKVQSIKPSVNITKLAEGFKVSIVNWDSGNQYQIWSRQQFTDDLFAGGIASQWVLSQAYTPGFSGTGEPDGSISFVIADFVSPDSNYTIAVRMTDVFGNYLGEIRDSYTPTDVSEVKIAKVLVDGEFSSGREIREIEAGAAMSFTVIGNDVADTVYTAKVVESGTSLTANSANEFGWALSALTPGMYTVQVTATNGETSDTKNIKVQLYSLDTGIQYGNISDLALTADEDNVLPKTLAITPDFTNGSFYYKVGEPGRTAIHTSGLFLPTDSIEYTFTKYGIYQVSGFVNREYEVKIGGYYDDGFIKQYTVNRSQTEPSTATLTATVNAEAVNLANPLAKGTTVLFAADAQIGGIGTTSVQYSFWRYDAKGYALVKDWSSDNTLDWTPARVGNYTIQVRAKGADAGSYEVAQSVKVTVTDATDQIAQGVVITVNEAELNLDAQARAPITVKANAASTNSEDLLYKFYVSDAAMGTTTLQSYSADSNCIWTPRKAGIYTISVLVKNDTSYGAYDAMEKFEITVN